MLEQSQEYQAAGFNVTLYASISLACMLADFICLLPDETKFVWPKFHSSWSARMYVLMRYGGMGSQIFNVYFAVRMYLGVYTTAAGCRRWFSFQAVVVQCLLGCVEGFLMRRIYALFLQSRIVLMIMVMFILGQIASMGVSARFSFPTNEYTVTCLLLRGNPGNAFFSTTTMTTTMVIFFMTFWKYLSLPAKWTRQGIGRIIFRDSAWTLSAISGLVSISFFLMMFLLTLSSLEVIKLRTSGNTIYYGLVCILWIAIGRIIVNHERLQRDTSESGEGEGNTWAATVQLTSQIEMGVNTLTIEARCTPSTSVTKFSHSTPLVPATKGGRLASPSVCTNGRADREMGSDSTPSLVPSRLESLPASHGGSLSTMSS